MRWRTLLAPGRVVELDALDQRRARGPEAALQDVEETLALARGGAQLLLEAPRQALVADHHHAEDGHDEDAHGEQAVEPAHVSILVIRRMSRKPVRKSMKATPSATRPSGLPATLSSVPGRVRSARNSAPAPITMTT